MKMIKTISVVKTRQLSKSKVGIRNVEMPPTGCQITVGCKTPRFTRILGIDFQGLRSR